MKFGLDLSPYLLDMTIRKFSEASDGNVHNDSKSKIVTSLIYFNPKWEHSGGRLRMVRNPDDIHDYGGEVVPEAGTLVSFRRSETAYHGFESMEGERRSLQMYWVTPKRFKKG
jgi:SM-20-related protein